MSCLISAARIFFYFSIRLKISDCFIIFLTEICSQIITATKMQRVTTPTQNDNPNRNESGPTISMLNALSVSPITQVNMVIKCLKLSLVSMIVPCLMMKQKSLEKSKSCSNPAMAKILKQMQPMKLNSQKIALQQISLKHILFSAVMKCSQELPGTASFMQSKLAQNTNSTLSRWPSLKVSRTHIHSQQAMAKTKAKKVAILRMLTSMRRFLTIFFLAMLNFSISFSYCSYVSPIWMYLITYHTIILTFIYSTMVKIKTITHQPNASVVHTPLAEHPFSRAREFQRAHNASKLQKIFAKPFLHSFQGHSDGISVVAKCPLSLNKFISGAHDGQIKIWDLTERKCLVSIYEHQQSVKGVAFNANGTKFLSSSADKTINLYDFKAAFENEDYEFHVSKEKRKMQPLTKYLSKDVIGNVDHSPTEAEFVTAGQIVQVWSYERTKPIYRLEWNIDSIFKVKYNPSEPNIICATGIDRSVILYDLRGESPIQKIYLNNKCPCLCFNPIEPINFTVGSEDSNCYSFDLRRMDAAKIIHRDHIGAITDIDYSPTGREFVTGSFDRTVRIFKFDQGRSREVYHSKRMQIVSSVIFTLDAHYILSGSEDMNIRLWKSQASMPTGVINDREKRALEYRRKLIEKFGENRKIKKILLHRHLPKYILNARKQRQEQTVSRHNKRANKEANTGMKQETAPQKVKAVEKIEIRDESSKRRRKFKSLPQNEEVENNHFEQ